MGSSALGLTKQFINGQIDAGKIVQDLHLNGRRTCKGTETTFEAQCYMYLAEDLGCNAISPGRTTRFTVLTRNVLSRSFALGPGTNHLLDTSSTFGHLLHGLIHLLPDTGNTKEDGGAYLLQRGAETSSQSIRL